ncbi:D-sedoheptulose-7-phosphate isomerase [Rhizobacter sp. LjRoot28]|uniref:D-sedoheptulose-7-phosphate isomerase n=1 Tax=Rhizobacter sp. LjRoot28 TaxID=3342309 RepID=UPI003ECE0D86
MKNLLQHSANEVIQLVDELRRDEEILRQMEALGASCVKALRDGGRILFAGNGGSAADAQHWAAELVGRFSFNRPALAGIALTTDTSAITAIGNDFGYEQIFARQLEALGRPGDVFVGISTSGNSKNVLLAAEYARSNGMVTAGFTGLGGGALAELCDHLLAMPSTHTPTIQQGHALLGHVLCDHVERETFGNRRLSNDVAPR